jgi:hypothetical protein
MASLRASADAAHTQRAVIQLGRTLAAMVRAFPDSGVARSELATLVKRIGPEARGLAWAGD